MAQFAPPVLLGTLCFLLLLSSTINAQVSSCGSRRTLNDCGGPDVGTHISRGSVDDSDRSCRHSGTLTCRGKSYPKYHCSSPVTSSTRAILTNNDFSKGSNGGGPSECDNSYHTNSERVVALSTGWYNKGSRCSKMIRITASNGRSTTARVVDECDSMNGCDAVHAYQPPCRNNVVDASNAVWSALRLNIDEGVVPVTWTMA